MNKQLGRLEKIKNIRDIWDTEDRDFTPWLAEENNIALLGEAIGLSLDVEAQEKAVGPFRADILCKDTADDSWVLIENQLERTDHKHLGQLMTYASGLKAVTIVWISTKFTEEHRSSLDWLNQITDDSFNFFGLEIELWKIGDSLIAPKFSVISKPNDWSRSVVAASKTAELSDSKLLQRDFWEKFTEFLIDNNSLLKAQKPRPRHYMNFAIGKSGVHLTAIASYLNSETNSWDGGEIRAEVYISGQYAKSYFDQFHGKKNQIEKMIGEPCIWHNPENKKSAGIYLRKSAKIKDKSDWNNQHQWLFEKLELLTKTFKPELASLVDE